MKAETETVTTTTYRVTLSEREYMLIYMALCSVNMLRLYECFDYVSDQMLLPDDSEYGKLFTQFHDNLEEGSCLL